MGNCPRRPDRHARASPAGRRHRLPRRERAGAQRRRHCVGQPAAEHGAAPPVHVHGVVVEAGGVERRDAQVDVRHAVLLDQAARLVVGLLVPVGALGRECHEAEARAVPPRCHEQALERHQRALLPDAPRVRELVAEQHGLLLVRVRLVVREKAAENELLHAIARRVARPERREQEFNPFGRRREVGAQHFGPVRDGREEPCQPADLHLVLVVEAPADEGHDDEVRVVSRPPEVALEHVVPGVHVGVVGAEVLGVHLDVVQAAEPGREQRGIDVLVHHRRADDRNADAGRLGERRGARPVGLELLELLRRLDELQAGNSLDREQRDRERDDDARGPARWPQRDHLGERLRTGNR